MKALTECMIALSLGLILAGCGSSRGPAEGTGTLNNAAAALERRADTMMDAAANAIDNQNMAAANAGASPGEKPATN